MDRALRQGLIIPRLGNAALAWDDLRIPINTTNKGGVQDPTFEKWNDDGSGSTGIYLNSFAKNTADTIFFETHILNPVSTIVFITILVNRLIFIPAISAPSNNDIFWCDIE